MEPSANKFVLPDPLAFRVVEFLPIRTGMPEMFGMWLRVGDLIANPARAKPATRPKPPTK
jgi:hypothetical protein